METYRLELTAGEMKITHAALRSMLDDFGHDERDVSRLLRRVLSKFPDAETIAGVDLSAELSPPPRPAA